MGSLEGRSLVVQEDISGIRGEGGHYEEVLGKGC